MGVTRDRVLLISREGSRDASVPTYRQPCNVCLCCPLGRPRIGRSRQQERAGAQLRRPTIRGSETISFQAVGILQSNQISGQLLDGTQVVVIVYIQGASGQIFYQVPGQLNRDDLWTCTIREIPGGIGSVPDPSGLTFNRRECTSTPT